MQSINIHVCLNIYLCVLTSCTIIFQQVCTIEPSFFNMPSGMYRRPIEGQHLVLCMESSFVYGVKFCEWNPIQCVVVERP